MHLDSENPKGNSRRLRGRSATTGTANATTAVEDIQLACLMRMLRQDSRS